MAALAVACAKQFEFSGAVAAWSAVAAIVCAIGSFLISSQPIGVATTAGRFGAALIRWGFRAGRGRLTLAAMISYLVWLILGTSTITAIKFPSHLPIVVAWSGDLLGLFYVVGVMLANRGGRIPASLVKLVASLGGLIVVSIFLWFHAGSDGARCRGGGSGRSASFRWRNLGFCSRDGCAFRPITPSLIRSLSRLKFAVDSRYCSPQTTDADRSVQNTPLPTAADPAEHEIDAAA